MRRSIVVMLGASVVACASPAPQPAAPAESILESTPSTNVPTATSTAASTAEPATASTTMSTSTDAVVPTGFDRVAALVTEPDGSTCELCLWLADTTQQRARGLMFVTDLGDADGMAFLYPAPHTGTFWMKDTVLPLSIAFFAPDGSFLDGFDMEPCGGDECPRYLTPDDFRIAVETTQGGLAGLGMVPGSTLELLDAPCPT